jgi:hypothetical protein
MESKLHHATHLTGLELLAKQSCQLLTSMQNSQLTFGKESEKEIGTSTPIIFRRLKSNAVK